MKRILTTIITVCVLGIVGIGFTQQRKTVKDPCKDPLTQVEMNFCSKHRYEKADAELNLVYKQLMRELEGYEKDHRPSFQQTQRIWLKYRDANCDSEASIYEGGSIRPTIYYSCLASVTQERTRRIKAFLDEVK